MTEATRTDRAAPLIEGDCTDPLEDGVRSRVRDFIETILKEELEAALGRGRYGRRSEVVTGYRGRAPRPGDRRRGRQGRGQPRLAQGDDRLGGVEHARPRRRGHRPADPGWHRRQGQDRQAGHGDPHSGRDRRAPRRSEGVGGVKNMGGETAAAWRALLQDLSARGLRQPELLIVDGAPGLEAALAEL